MIITTVDGRMARIDREIYDELMPCRFRFSSHGYLIAAKPKQKIYVHRFALKASKGFLVDHKNRDKSDNRRVNLRFATRSQNSMNSCSRSHNKSGYRGVSFCRQTKKWRASIRVNNKTIQLGRFNSKEDAAITYDRNALKYHGEFARTNFIPYSGEPGKGCDQ